MTHASLIVGPSLKRADRSGWLGRFVGGLFFSPFVFCFLGMVAFTALPAFAATELVDFNFHIRPLLSDRCYTCHGPDEKSRKAKLRLDTSDGVFGSTKSGKKIVAPGDRAASDLWQRVTSKDPDALMPPPDSHLKLSPEEIETLGQWIDQGAKHRQHWAFNPLEAISVPPTGTSDWGRTPIDAFVLKTLSAHHLKPSPEATREQWIRRVSFDLIGLPPGTEEVDSFLADATPQAYEKVVDRLLRSEAYGERMASEWMDLARYADTYGYQSDVDRDMSPWRDWVIRSFNRNLPFSDFLLWQIAGDLLPNPTQEQYLATAFNRLHRQTNEGGSIEEEFRTEYVADRVHTVGTTFLALTFECSRCHDHKYDPISQKDYYRMFAFFNNVEESGLYPHFTAATPTPTLFLYPEGGAARHDALRQHVQTETANVKQLELEARQRFEEWKKTNAVAVAAPAPVASFSFDEVVTNRFLNRVDPLHPAQLVESPELVPGRSGKAVKFSGDNSVNCRGVGDFKRTDPFSVAVWMRPTELQTRSVVWHHSRAWTDSGSRGYELILDLGRPQFSLIHFWPGNAISIRARKPIALNQWSHLTACYDGSSRAEGLSLYLDGQRLDTEVIKDLLYRDIQHRSEWGDSEAGGIDFILGGRFRDSGFRNGELDELQLFNRCLAPSEVSRLVSTASGNIAASDSLGLTEYLARIDEPYRLAKAALQKAREEENQFITGVREIMVMKERAEPRASFVLRRGAYDAPGDRVFAGVPERIMAMPPEYPTNRLGLARWMIDPRHPLTSRVAVNRLWKLHFGRGLVATVQDFGAQGQLPSHPELLDWLSKRFIDSGWNQKELQKQIVLSSTYRQSSQASPEAIAADPENRWLARGPKHRLSAEQIRDNALAVSGLLVKKVGGPSVKPYQPPGVWEEAGTGKSYTQDKGEKLYRRSLYTFWRRTAPPPSMLSFDATSREVCTAKREITATPLQSLVLLNDVQFLEAARVLAERLTQRYPGDVSARIEEAFRVLTSRRPQPRELETLRRLFEEQRAFYSDRPKAAEQLLALGETRSDANLSKPELAATAMMVSTLMNHDEFVTKR